MVSNENAHISLNHMVYFGPIMHHSAGNDLFVFHTFLLAPDTFTTGRSHYGQLIHYLLSDLGTNTLKSIQIHYSYFH